jgi:hypothetical protein
MTAKCARSPLFALMAAGSLFAQTNEPHSLAAFVLSERPALDTAPDLARWGTMHPNERLRPAAYDNEYETQGLWCAASVAEVALPGGIHATRQAFFYIPLAKPGGALPARRDAGLAQHCRLLALWYEVRDPADPGGLARAVSAELAASLGPAEEPAQFKRPSGDWGSGYWNPYLIWERANRSVVLAVDPGGNIPDPKAHTRLLVIARAAQAPRGSRFDWMGEAPKAQPSLKACAFDDGRNNWHDGLIRAGQKLLRDLPASPSKPYIHLTMARAYDAKLILTYPDIDLDGATRPTDPEALRRNAIAHFRAFLAETPNSPESAVARREAWRLLAGLPPTPIHFACTD